ncbi:MAG: protein translocase subunit SecDF [Sphingobacteriaceae bacterium]|nr:protein translocase subunit SecDF [Sphingobacteriaceae bacterium]
MKSKGLVRSLVIAFALVCIYQLSFTLVSSRVESKARKFAGGDPVKEKAYLDSISDQKVYNLLVKSFTYQQVKEQQLNLGLDLQGGMNVVMEVSVSDVVRALSNYSKDASFNKAIEMAVERQRSSQLDFVTLFEQAYNEVDPNGKLAAIFATRENQGKIDYNSSNAQVIEMVRQESEGAIDRSFNILRTRIDKFGVTSPNIQRQQGTGRIIIELPGVDKPERVRRLLQGTAKLEFWETYESGEVIERIFEINKMLADKEKLEKAGTAKETLTKADTAAKSEVSADNDLMQKLAAADTASAAAGDSGQLSDAQARLENPLFSLLMPAIFQGEDGQTRAMKGPVVGTASAKDTAKVNKIMAMDEARALLPRNLKLLWTVKGRGDGNKFFDLVAIKTRSNDERAPLEGDVITDARETIDNFGQVEVSMTMNAEGAKIWRRLTADNISRSIAIVLDDYVYSYPNVNQEISGGMSSISGGFSTEEAKDLANILKAGKLPAPARIVEEAIVGPSLGAEAINAGLISVIGGLLLVLVFMVAYYAKAGIVANVALFANIFFIFGVLASLQAVLTLPGIAGIVLTIGMAVDANVLIFERIREEMERGKSMRQAISDGFKNSLSSIIDANVTTLLTGIILYSFGTGPIRGFATTLIVGILTSLFCALFITRLLIEWYMNKDKEVNFGTKWSMGVFSNLNIDFLSKRKMWYGISGAVIVAGMISMFTQGFNLGVDFKGGRSYVVSFEEGKRATDLRSALSGAFGSSPEVKTFGSDTKFKITTSYKINEEGDEVDALVEQKLYEGLSTIMTNKVDFETFKAERILSSQKVGPTIADDIKASAIMSIIFSLVVISIYILIRFRKANYAIGAAVALLHDVLFVLSIFTLTWKFMPFSMEIDQAFIAAILTIVGYSINDTVVVFDRLREYLNLHHGKDSKEVINNAVNSTFSRTIITALTTILVVFVLFLFGGEVIKGFTFALLIGLFVGTYSSIFIASAIVLDTAKWFESKKSVKG